MKQRLKIQPLKILTIGVLNFSVFREKCNAARLQDKLLSLTPALALLLKILIYVLEIENSVPTLRLKIIMLQQN